MIAQDIASDVLVQAAREVFDTMIFLDLEPAVGTQAPRLGDSLVGSITFTGGAEGCFAITCGEAGADVVARSMLGMGPDDPLDDADIRDAVGEVTNMVMGTLKSLVADILGDLHVSVPTITQGRDLLHGLGDDAQQMHVAVTVGGTHPVELAFCWRA